MLFGFYTSSKPCSQNRKKYFVKSTLASTLKNHAGKLKTTFTKSTSKTILQNLLYKTYFAKSTLRNLTSIPQNQKKLKIYKQ